MDAWLEWARGPAFRFAYRPGPWNLGAVVMNFGSYAGDSDRKDVHQLLIRGLLRRRLTPKWYFTYSPIIIANWNGSSRERWLIRISSSISWWGRKGAGGSGRST